MDYFSIQFYHESFVRMRHQCALKGRKSLRTKTQFYDVFCAQWQQMMIQNKYHFKTPQQLTQFNKYFYHPGDIAYRVLTSDAYKIMENKALNMIKKSFWKGVYGTRMPLVFGRPLRVANLQEKRKKILILRSRLLAKRKKIQFS